MPSKLSWYDAEDIAIELKARHADVNPLSVRFTDLHKWVTEIPGFADDPKLSNESILERIQMAWLDEVQ
ncbi:MAG TPA: Fe-S cluster assembly protein IscX [Planctomycetota bacterium]|nr:Fe-S cluster assembly protein IscX [Planctomycetota bacterium]